MHSPRTMILYHLCGTSALSTMHQSSAGWSSSWSGACVFGFTSSPTTRARELALILVALPLPRSTAPGAGRSRSAPGDFLRGGVQLDDPCRGAPALGRRWLGLGLVVYSAQRRKPTQSCALGSSRGAGVLLIQCSSFLACISSSLRDRPSACAASASSRASWYPDLYAFRQFGSIGCIDFIQFSLSLAGGRPVLDGAAHLVAREADKLYHAA